VTRKPPIAISPLTAEQRAMREALPIEVFARFDNGMLAKVSFNLTACKMMRDPVVAIMKALDDQVRSLLGLIAWRYEHAQAASEGRKPRTLAQIDRAIARARRVKP